MKKAIWLTLVLIVIVVPLAGVRYGKNKVQKKVMEWSMIETTHFDIYFKKGADEFGKIAALMSEEAYYYLKEDFEQPIKYRIPIIFYESHTDFESTNIIYPLLTEGVGGFTEHMKNRVVVPFDGSYVKLEEVLIHELTHSYQKAAMSRGGPSFLHLTDYPLPFWFQEGQPEFQSIGGGDNYNNMFIIDMVVNDYLPWLENLGGYYAYRVGESFITWIAEEYGRKTVMKLFYASRLSRNMDVATEKVLGLKFQELQQLWRVHLKKKFYPYLEKFDLPITLFERRTDHNEDQSQMNYAPRFSPDGQKFLFFSNKDYRLSIWKGSTLGISPNEFILSSGDDGRFEEFHHLRNNFSWLPDGDRFAFVAKTSRGDRLYIMDFESEEILETHEVGDLDNMYEIDIAADGHTVVLCGQKDMAVDLYLYDLTTRQLSKITSDRYNESAPRWSPDGRKIAFASERTMIDSSDARHVFYGMERNIFYYDLDESRIMQVTFDAFDNHSPFWTPEGDGIIFITEEDHVANFEVIQPEQGTRARVTNTLSGVFTGDIEQNGDYLIFSCFFDNGWDVYLMSDPLSELEYKPYRRPEPVQFKDDLYARFNIERYRFHGIREGRFKKELSPVHNRNVTTIDFGNVAQNDSLAREYNRKLDTKPSKEGPVVPTIEPYEVDFSLDRFWGGAAYSSSGGAFGFLQLSMSDLMGDHGIGARIGLASDWKDSNIIINYLYLPRRIDYGFGMFYTSNETIYGLEYTYDGFVYDNREVDRRGGIYNLISYPWNMYWRIDIENLIYQRKIDFDFWDSVDREWVNYDSMEGFVWSPQLSFVHDTAMYGPTGPIEGDRWIFLTNKSFSETFDYYTNYLDLRKYFLFNKRYSVAMRLLAGMSVGKYPQRFELRGFSGVRGVTQDIEGDRKVLTSLELRYPFLDYLQLGFPLPITLGQIRGSVFMDAGSVWYDKDGFVGADSSGELQDIRVGFGFGPRINLGMFILKLDIAWQTDFIGTSEPSYFLSLEPDF